MHYLTRYSSALKKEGNPSLVSFTSSLFLDPCQIRVGNDPLIPCPSVRSAPFPPLSTDNVHSCKHFQEFPTIATVRADEWRMAMIDAAGHQQTTDLFEFQFSFRLPKEKVVSSREELCDQKKRSRLLLV